MVLSSLGKAGNLATPTLEQPPTAGGKSWELPLLTIKKKKKDDELPLAFSEATSTTGENRQTDRVWLGNGVRSRIQQGKISGILTLSKHLIRSLLEKHFIDLHAYFSPQQVAARTNHHPRGDSPREDFLARRGLCLGLLPGQMKRDRGASPGARLLGTPGARSALASPCKGWEIKVFIQLIES